MYYLYILRCWDDSLYTGITSNLEKRIKMHTGEIPGGAKYTRGRQPLELIYNEYIWDRSQATKKELAIKKLSKEKKLEYITFHKKKIH
jgi:putative endonuclease